MTRGKKYQGWLLVAALFLLCTLVYGLLSSYPRELAVYSDEVRYLDIARSLWQGRGLRVRNMPSDYQKILYPLCILPALLLKTTAAQITAIGWLNAAWASSAVFPAYALARATGQNRRRTAFLVGITAVLPTLSACATFMSETVFLPLSLWQVYFLWRAMAAAPRARIAWSALAGAWCFLLYLNKEVALYYLIAWVLLRLWVTAHDPRSWRGELAGVAAMLGAFLVCLWPPNSPSSPGWATPTTRPAGSPPSSGPFCPSRWYATCSSPCWPSGSSRCWCPWPPCAAPAPAPTPAAPSCRCFCCWLWGWAWGWWPGASL